MGCRYISMDVYIRMDRRADGCGIGCTGCSTALVHVMRLFGFWRGNIDASATEVRLRESAGLEDSNKLPYAVL